MKALLSFRNSVGIFTETYRYLQKSKSPRENINSLKIQWAKSILEKLKVEVEVLGKPSHDKSILFVGNHISYLDIPLLMATATNVSFVAKYELNSWPVFGEAARKVETVFVKREDGQSRKSARASIQTALDEGTRVVIFPSGTTCTQESKSWRKGAFEIAQLTKAWVQPFRITYSPLRAVAYIDKDFFPTHLYNLFGFNKIVARIEFHQPVKIESPSWDSIRWHYWSRGLVE